MKQNIRLFIEGYEADLGTTPDILFNYAQTDLNNPTVIKNGYSKTVALEGTSRNSDIFGNIWDLERMQGGTYSSNFNPSKKVLYELRVDNEIVESGYLKLNSISRKKDISVFNVTLYSSLGDFFYSLSYNANGDKLKLSDLTFLPSAETHNGTTYYFQQGDDTEFDMTITHNNLLKAWENVEWNPVANFAEYRKYKYMNFAPSYNAIPSDNFSADKVLLNFNGSEALASSVTEDGKTYTTHNGYALATLPSDIDEWGVRDLRSYLQRPVLRVKGMINAICNYAGNSGYNVELSPAFFNDDNPYWNDTWMTLPLLTEMQLVGTDADAAKQSVTFTSASVITYNGWYNERIILNTLPELPVGTERIEVQLDFITKDTRTSPLTSGTMYTSAFVGGEKNFSAYAIQLVALDGDVIAASDAAFLTSKVGNQYLTPSDALYSTALNKSYFNDFGQFEAVGDGSFKWSNTVTLTIDSIPSATERFGLIVTALANVTTGTSSINGSQYYTYGSRRGRCYRDTTIAATAETNTRYLYTAPSDTALNMSGETTMKSNTAGYSGAKVSKRTLLDTKETPADYLISFCKQFNLHFLKNPYNKTVKILTRGEFFERDKVSDIQELIDRTDYSINPVTFDKKYYDLSLESVGGDFSDKYTATYSRIYGSQRVDTGYEFDTEPKQVLSGNTLKTAIQCVQKSKYYLSPIATGIMYRTPSYLYQGMKYVLYNGTLSSGTTKEMEADLQTYDFPTLGGDKFYDWIDKPQFKDADGKAVKGEKVLLFYNGIKSAVNSNGIRVEYVLSDDVSAMGLLNDGTPCYLYSESNYNTGGTEICVFANELPHFSRYKTSGSSITYSLDFGEPKQLYIDNIVSNTNATLYRRYWDRYLSDLYDVNNRVVTAKVQLEKRPSYELLRRFYWFDNSYWCLNKIKNYNVCSLEPTECEFVKVRALRNYSDIPSGIYIGTTPSAITSASTQIEVEVECDNNWELSGDTSIFSSLPSSGYGNSTFTVTVGANTGDSRTLILRATDMVEGLYSDAEIKQATSSYIDFQLSSGYSDTIPLTGGTVEFTLATNRAWNLKIEPYGMITYTASQSSGSATQGTTISIDFGAKPERAGGAMVIITTTDPECEASIWLNYA